MNIYLILAFYLSLNILSKLKYAIFYAIYLNNQNFKLFKFNNTMSKISIFNFYNIKKSNNYNGI